MRIRRLISGLVPAFAILVLASCAMPAPVGGMASAEPTRWVVMTFADTDDEFVLATMDALLGYELEADSALQGAGAGWIDGNEIGDHQYDLVGFDRAVMWDLIRPVFDSA